MLCSAVALSAIAAVAFAQTGPGDSGGAAGDGTGTSGRDAAGAGTATAGEWGSFSEADRDGNGFIDKGEAAEVTGLDFTGVDRDGDGRISPAEFEAGVQGALGAEAPVPPGSGRTDGATGGFGQEGGDPRGGEEGVWKEKSR